MIVNTFMYATVTLSHNNVMRIIPESNRVAILLSTYS